MAAAWRFFAGEDGRWYWEQIRSTGSMRSATGYESYEACVKGATASGYSFLPSQQRIAQGASTRRSAPARGSGTMD